VTTGSSVAGRVFALTGALTLDTNAINAAPAGTGGGGGGGGQHCNDITTGRGSITGPSGSKAKFDFKAGFKGGEDESSSPRGEVVYIDDGFECVLKMKSTSITAYLEKGPNSRLCDSVRFTRKNVQGREFHFGHSLGLGFHLACGLYRNHLPKKAILMCINNAGRRSHWLHG
jgi:hypothetical protein